MLVLWDIEDPFGSRNRMERSIKLYSWRDHDIFPDGDEIIVGEITVAIDKGVFAYGDVLAVIAAKRLFQPYTVSDGAQARAFQYLLTLFVGIRRYAVESVYQSSRFVSSLPGVARNVDYNFCR